MIRLCVSAGNRFGGDDVATAAALAAMEAVSHEELAAKRAAKKAAFNTEYDAGVARPMDSAPHSAVALLRESRPSSLLGVAGLSLELATASVRTLCSPCSACISACLVNTASCNMSELALISAG